MFPLFNALLAPFVPLLVLFTLIRRAQGKADDESLLAQWGIYSPLRRHVMRSLGEGAAPVVWIHAVSVGETMAAKPIIKALREQIPDVKIALSTSTRTGQDIAKQMWENREINLAFYFPLDLAPTQNRVLNALRPDAILFVETELWPNLLHLARKKSIPTFLVNGRVSDNLLQSAPKLGPLWRWMSGNLTGFLMRGESDAARLETLGVAREKIVVAGDVKLEMPPLQNEIVRRKWRDELGVGEAERVVVCGSTHEGEEAIWLEIARQKPKWRIAFAPRHPNRFDAVAALIETEGFETVRRSSGEKWRDGAIFLLDSVGELGDFYALGDAAFVGGSLIPRGGHNLLEPILRGAPVCFGPQVRNFLAQRDLILAHHLGAQVSDSGEIAAWLEAPQPTREEFARRVETALLPHRGAAALMARHISEEIHRKGAKTQRKSL